MVRTQELQRKNMGLTALAHNSPTENGLMAPVANDSAIGLDENPDLVEVKRAVMVLLDSSYAEKCSALAQAIAIMAEPRGCRISWSKFCMTSFPTCWLSSWLEADPSDVTGRKT